MNKSTISGPRALTNGHAPAGEYGAFTCSTFVRRSTLDVLSRGVVDPAGHVEGDPIPSNCEPRDFGTDHDNRGSTPRKLQQPADPDQGPLLRPHSDADELDLDDRNL